MSIICPCERKISNPQFNVPGEYKGRWCATCPDKDSNAINVIQQPREVRARLAYLKVHEVEKHINDVMLDIKQEKVRIEHDVIYFIAGMNDWLIRNPTQSHRDRPRCILSTYVEYPAGLNTYKRSMKSMPSNVSPKDFVAMAHRQVRTILGTSVRLMEHCGVTTLRFKDVQFASTLHVVPEQIEAGLTAVTAVVASRN